MRVFTHVLIFVILVACSSATKADNAIECAKSAIGPDSLVRIDEKRQRFFIIETQVTRTTLKPLIAKIKNCLDHTAWQDKWSLSVFSESKLAGYKDELDTIPFHKTGEWAKGYLAEYDAVSDTLMFNPVTSSGK